jgi:hypothetical protein
VLRSVSWSGVRTACCACSDRMVGWPTAQHNSDIPAVHEALEAFSQDSTEDNAVGLICAILNASPYTAGRAAGLEEAAKICGAVNNHDNPMTARDCADATLPDSGRPAFRKRIGHCLWDTR